MGRTIPFSLIAPSIVDVRGLLPIRVGARGYYDRPLDGIVGITDHYTASEPKSGLEAVIAIALYQISIQNPNDDPDLQPEFPAIAYTIIVDDEGIPYLCHDLSTRVWHSGAVVNGVARNASHVGICYIGNYEPTAKQLLGMAVGIKWVQETLGRELSLLEGHKDQYATTCPGPTWPSWKSKLLDLLK